MKRGELWFVELPQRGGREQSGRRPVAIVQDDGVGTRSPLVIIVPLSSQLEALRFPGCVKIEPTPQNGLSTTSVALGFQIVSVDRVRFRSYLGTLDDSDLQKIDNALKQLLGYA